MKIHIYAATCEVCGEDGMATPQDMRDFGWSGGLRHSNPDYCAAVLRRLSRELQRREDALAEAEASW